MNMNNTDTTALENAIAAYRTLAQFNEDHADAGLSTLNPHMIRSTRDALTAKSSAAAQAYALESGLDPVAAVVFIMASA